MEAFENYFKRADANQDGKISGSEAVAFFQGSGLPQQVLAQIWMYADQSKTGFLGRPEFFNALRLVTVAQGGHALKPDIVKSALYGPAAAKIPPPKINSTSPAPQIAPSSQMGALNAPQMGGLNAPQMGALYAPQMGALNAAQYAGARAPQVVNTSMGFNQQMTRPAQTGVGLGLAGGVPNQSPVQMPGVGLGMAGTVPSQSLQRPGVSQGLGGIQMPGVGAGLTGTLPSQSPLQMPGVSQGLAGNVQSQSPLQMAGVSQGLAGNARSQSPVQMPGVSQGLAGNARSQSPVQMPGVNQGLAGGNTSTMGGLSVDWLSNKTTNTPQITPNNNTDAFGLSSLTSTTGAPAGNAKALVPVSAPGTTNVASFANLDPIRSNQVQASQVQVSGKQENSTGTVGTQTQWPKMSKADVNKYTKVFSEVDKDRDGRITGLEARNLFLSWKLPREVLKQVWDLSDQDNDGMLSLREFCIALYLMEKHRQGATLPKQLPDSLRYDETLLQATGLPAGAYAAGPTWQQQPPPGMANRPPVPGAAPGMMRPPLPGQMQQHVRAGQPKSTHHAIDNNNNININNNNVVNNREIAPPQEVAGAEKKAPEIEKHILDSKEKIEYFRNKMQDLVLYKSRCDNRLNEITERALSDKREVESLAKKYEEKYKQVGDIASKLAVEEASIRDIHERKTELQNALVKMEQGGSADGLLQVRADRIQYQLEELEKAMAERCKHFGLNVKPSFSIELPPGWEPGAPEGALDWDEEWDKFDDEGFMVVKANTTEVEHVTPSEKETRTASPLWNDDSSSADGFSPVSNGHIKNDRRFDNELNEESPGRASAFESPFVNSPRIKDDFNDHDGAESSIFGDQYANEASWNFDDTDTESVWGANTLDTDNHQNSFFTSGGDFGLDPVRTNSPSASSIYGNNKKKNSFFDDSVPSSPSFSAAGFSPKFNDTSSFNYGRFDSFKTEDSSGFFGQEKSNSQFGRFDSISSSKGETLSRFDSMRSTTNTGHNRGFDSFDENDPFGSTGPFKASGKF